MVQGAGGETDRAGEVAYSVQRAADSVQGAVIIPPSQATGLNKKM